MRQAAGASAGGLPERECYRVIGGYPTQPPAELLHSGCTANDPPDVLMSCRLIQAHLSPISWPEESYQALSSGSVMASASSWPSTMLTPSSVLLTESSPQDAPASVM